MPLHLPKYFPAIERLREEDILVERRERDAACGQAKPIRIAVLNLMPMKITTETDLVRLLSASPLDIELGWMRLRSHTSTHVPGNHLDTYYQYFDELAPLPWDGLIVTGAPVEHLAFEEVDYWHELTEIFSWARQQVKSTVYICWAAQAGLYYHYGIQKYPLQRKMFGIFPQRILQPRMPVFRGFDDVFCMPHSRHTEIRKEDILRHKELSLLVESDESGVGMVTANGGTDFFITGHMEYAPDTLDQEYHRDVGKRDDVDMPQHYYRDDDPAEGPLVTWRAHANLLFMNWINEYLR